MVDKEKTLLFVTTKLSNGFAKQKIVAKQDYGGKTMVVLSWE